MHAAALQHNSLNSKQTLELCCSRREKRQCLKKQEQVEEDEKEITALKDEAYDRLSAAEALCDRLNDGLHVLKMCPTGAKYSRDKDLSVKVSTNT